MKYDLSTFEFPKTEKEMDQFGCFPMSTTYLEDGETEVPHPLITLLKTNANANVESVEVTNDWTDDHEICIDVVVVVDGKKYGISLWWLTREGYKTAIRAETGAANHIKKLVELLTEY